MAKEMQRLENKVLHDNGDWKKVDDSVSSLHRERRNMACRSLLYFGSKANGRVVYRFY